MEVQVKFIGVPAAVKAVGQKEITARPDGATLGDLLRHLDGTYGPALRKAMFNQKGDVDDAIQILHNGSSFVSRDALDQHLDDGDQITFMMMMAGG